MWHIISNPQIFEQYLAGVIGLSFHHLSLQNACLLRTSQSCLHLLFYFGAFCASCRLKVFVLLLTFYWAVVYSKDNSLHHIVQINLSLEDQKGAKSDKILKQQRLQQQNLCSECFVFKVHVRKKTAYYQNDYKDVVNYLVD